MRASVHTVVLLCVICFSMILSGCGDKVKAEYREIDEVINEQGNIQDKLPELKFDNLELPDRLMTVDTDKLYTFVSKPTLKDKDYTTDEQKSYLKTLIRKFVGDYDETLFFTDGDLYLYSDEHCVAFITPLGGFGVAKLEPETNSEAEDTAPVKIEVEKVIHVDRGESTDVTYRVGGKELPLNDAIKMAEETWQLVGLKERLRDDEDYRLRYILINKKLSSGDDIEYTYQLVYSILKNGVALIDTGGTPNADAFPFNTMAVVSFDGKPEVTEIMLECYVDTSGAKEYTGKVVSLESALAMASDYLASYRKYTVPEIGMVYCAIAAGYRYTELDYRPMWRIILEEEQHNCNSRQPVIALYVDMTNGDMFLFDDQRGEMLGTKKGD